MVLLLLQLLAQEIQHPTAYRSSSELVVLHVSVVDRHAGFVPGLPKEAFTVFEGVHGQPIAFFENEDTAVSVGLVIDSSGSMAPRREAVIAAGMSFAESSRADDEIFTLSFNERIWPGLPEGQPFTSDHDSLHQALNNSGARGQTALFDAIDLGLRHLDEGTKTRKVLIVVSDGGDNASHRHFEEILDAALRRDVVIYTVGIYDPNDTDAKPGVLRDLASATGGEAFFPKTLDQVKPALDRIARDIRSSYTIGYVPPSEATAGVRRSIRVEAKAPDGRKLSVRARSAYHQGRGGATWGRIAAYPVGCASRSDCSLSSRPLRSSGTQGYTSLRHASRRLSRRNWTGAARSWIPAVRHWIPAARRRRLRRASSAASMFPGWNSRLSLGRASTRTPCEAQRATCPGPPCRARWGTPRSPLIETRSSGRSGAFAWGTPSPSRLRKETFATSFRVRALWIRPTFRCFGRRASRR